MLALFEKDAVTQSEGETLGHAMALARLNYAAALGSATVVVLRDPISRILSRYHHEGRISDTSSSSSSSSTSPSPPSYSTLESWLDDTARRSQRGGTRVWQVRFYFILHRPTWGKCAMIRCR